MKLFNRDIRTEIGYAAGILALLVSIPAGAQENLDHGKTAAQLFASDCAICHKTVQGLSKAGGPLGLGLESFLREHYTASRESAALLAKYVQALDTGPAPAPEKRGKRSAKGSDKPKGDGKAEASKKPGDSKPGDAKSDDAKSGEAKSGDAKPAETKPASKPADSAKADKPEKFN